MGITFGLLLFLGTVFAVNFTDTGGHWAEKNLIWAIDKGLLKGDDVAEGEPETLRPDDDVTRAEMVTILKRYDELRLSGQNNNSTNEYSGSFATTIGGITWIGRKSSTLNSEGVPGYQIIKVDALGNGSVVYELPNVEFFSGVDWNLTENGKYLVIKVSEGFPEGAVYNEIGFKDGKETIRSKYNTYGSFQQNLTFTLPGSLTTYNVTLATAPNSKACEGQEGKVAVPQTTLTGVKISSGETSKLFELPEPITVDCALLDGYFQEHQPQNSVTNVHGISFSLPNGDKAWLSTSQGAEKMSINFQPGDSNYLN